MIRRKIFLQQKSRDPEGPVKIGLDLSVIVDFAAGAFNGDIKL